MEKKINKRSGFTLIEMAVVLVIIGLILGAVSIGKDMQRNAEFKKIKQKFVDQWATAYNEYYDKYGVVVGDSQTKPTLAVNGNESAAMVTAFYAVTNNNYFGVGPPKRLCSSSDDLDNETANDTAPGSGRIGTTTAYLHAFFDAAGIEMPPGRSEGKEDKYLYLDTNGNPQEVQVCFQWNKPTTPSGSGNVMVIIGLTPDLARQLDQMIDGKPDACEGQFRAQEADSGYGCATTAGGAVGAPWVSTNVDDLDGGTSNLDENQILTVTAHYKMNQ